MKIKKYVARNMPEALQQVREDLGDEAVILNTRQIRRNNRFNLHDEARVEVTAAFDESTAAPPVEAEEARKQIAPLAAQKYAVQSDLPIQPESLEAPPLRVDRIINRVLHLALKRRKGEERIITGQSKMWK